MMQSTIPFTVETPSIDDLAERVRDNIFDMGGSWFGVEQVEVHDDWYQVDTEQHFIVIEGTATITGVPQATPAYLTTV